MNLGELPHSFIIFGERDFGSVHREIMQNLRNKITHIDQNTLLNANEPDLIESLVDEFSCSTVNIDFDFISMTHKEGYKEINDYDRTINQSVLHYRFHLPVSGEVAILKMITRNRINRSIRCTYDGSGEISFEITGTSNNTDNVIREKNSYLDVIKKQLEYANDQVIAHNDEVKRITPTYINSRKAQILKQMESVAAIGVPLKKKTQVSETFTVPNVKRKPKIIEQPELKNTAFEPEPTLHVDVYNEILKLIQDFGIEIERHPSIYDGKDEESLRDFFILILSPHFEGGVTGETFNKVGKTDILIRYESSNVFVAECKFWRGKKEYFEAIDQTLGYLTWRDSKAALICFINNVNLDPVLKQIEELTPNHNCYAETLKVEDGRHEYRFHLIEDDTRNVFLTVLCFHYPRVNN